MDPSLGVRRAGCGWPGDRVYVWRAGSLFIACARPRTGSRRCFVGRLVVVYVGTVGT